MAEEQKVTETPERVSNSLRGGGNAGLVQKDNLQPYED